MSALGTEWAKRTYASVNCHTPNAWKGPVRRKRLILEKEIPLCVLLEITNAEIHNYCITQSVVDSASVTE